MQWDDIGSSHNKRNVQWPSLDEHLSRPLLGVWIKALIQKTVFLDTARSVRRFLSLTLTTGSLNTALDTGGPLFFYIFKCFYLYCF